MPISESSILAALATVDDPEIRKPITELQMVDGVQIGDDGVVEVRILLTTAGCPLRATITSDVEAAVSAVEGVTGVSVTMGVMSEEQKRALRESLTGHAEREIPFTRPDSLTRVVAVASGKGGVGKSSVTANLAVALADQGLKVGVLDADIYGFSLPRMLGIATQPQSIDGMIVPPIGTGDVKVISIGMFVPEGQPVIWRGPMLHRALQQFLADVFWGDLDVLLLDMPPGTGDVAISVAQLLPGSEELIVTTPQMAAAEVAERSGTIAGQTGQRAIGVVENMSAMVDASGNRVAIFGEGGGQRVANRLTQQLGYQVPLLAEIPLDIAVREGGDRGKPVVLADPASPAGKAFRALAAQVGSHTRGLAGRKLGVSPV